MRRCLAWMCAEVALTLRAGILTLLWAGRERISAVDRARNTAQWPFLPCLVFSGCVNSFKLFFQLNWTARININNNNILEASLLLLLLFLEVRCLTRHVCLKAFRFLFWSPVKVHRQPCLCPGMTTQWENCILKYQLNLIWDKNNKRL